MLHMEILYIFQGIHGNQGLGQVIHNTIVYRGNSIIGIMGCAIKGILGAFGVGSTLWNKMCKGPSRMVNHYLGWN